MEARCCTRLGDKVIDLSVLYNHKLLQLNVSNDPFFYPHLNNFIALGKDTWAATRQQLQKLFSDNEENVKKLTEIKDQLFYNLDEVKFLLPCKVGDYTDFYSSKDHATNVGTMFRGKDNALQPNWVWLPVGYHGRSSSIVVSPAEFKRPQGQKKPTGEGERPGFEKSKRMDFELEMVTVVGKSNPLGESVKMDDGWDHIFGFCLMNDVSARDLQAWEYVPLGPFTAKNCITVVSPWIVSQEALEPFRIKLDKQDPQPHEYLNDKNHSSFDIPLEVLI